MVSASTKAGAHQRMPSSKNNNTGKSKANGKLDTSPSRAAAIRRGEIQISGPIPITNDLDREPTGPRSTVTTFRTRSDISQRRVQLSREGSQTESTADHINGEIDRSHQSSRNQLQPSPMDRTQAEELMEDGSGQHTPGSSRSRNLHESFRSVRSKSDSEKPGRKGGRLRVVLRRLFGRKSFMERRIESQQFRETPEPSARVEHKSDPGVLSKASQQFRPHNLQRSASAPARELSRPAPLASSSPLPFADPPPLDLDHRSHNRDSAQNEEEKEIVPAMRNSLIFPTNEGIAYADWTGLAPRPASSHERSSKLIDPEMGIGFAITSGTNPRRRSRSADPVPKAREVGFGPPPPSIRRRRSDEIRYWRESSFSERLPLSPISSDKRSERAPEEFSQSQPESPPQAFNFGPLIGEMKTMKITEAAFIESRVRTLEIKVANMQSAVWKLRGRPSGGVFTVQDLARRGDGEDTAHFISSVPLSQPFEQADKSPGDESPSPLESMYPETFLSSPDVESESSSKKDRPSSLSTAIWAPPNQEGLSSLDENLHSPLPSAPTHEHLRSLITTIKREQKARRKLESQVSTLYSLIEEMRRAGYSNGSNQTGRSAIASTDKSSGGQKEGQGEGQEHGSYPESRPTQFMEFDGTAGGGEDDTYILDGYATSEDVFGTPLTQPLAEMPTPEQKEYFFSGVVSNPYNSAPRQELQPDPPTDHHRLSLSQLTTRSAVEQVS